MCIYSNPDFGAEWALENFALDDANHYSPQVEGRNPKQAMAPQPSTQQFVTWREIGKIFVSRTIEILNSKI